MQGRRQLKKTPVLVLLEDDEVARKKIKQHPNAEYPVTLTNTEMTFDLAAGEVKPIVYWNHWQGEQTQYQALTFDHLLPFALADIRDNLFSRALEASREVRAGRARLALAPSQLPNKAEKKIKKRFRKEVTRLFTRPSKLVAVLAVLKQTEGELANQQQQQQPGPSSNSLSPSFNSSPSTSSCTSTNCINISPSPSPNPSTSSCTSTNSINISPSPSPSSSPSDSSNSSQESAASSCTPKTLWKLQLLFDDWSVLLVSLIEQKKTGPLKGDLNRRQQALVIKTLRRQHNEHFRQLLNADQQQNQHLNPVGSADRQRNDHFRPVRNARRQHNQHSRPVRNAARRQHNQHFRPVRKARRKHLNPVGNAAAHLNRAGKRLGLLLAKIAQHAVPIAADDDAALKAQPWTDHTRSGLFNCRQLAHTQVFLQFKVRPTGNDLNLDDEPRRNPSGGNPRAVTSRRAWWLCRSCGACTFWSSSGMLLHQLLVNSNHRAMCLPPEVASDAQAVKLHFPYGGNRERDFGAFEECGLGWLDATARDIIRLRERLFRDDEKA